MKISTQLPLFLALLFSIPVSASAASLAEVQKQIDDLRQRAESDMAFVAKNGRNCTNHFGTLGDALNKTAARVGAARAALNEAFSKVSTKNEEGSCKTPDLKEVKFMLKGIQAARDHIDFIVDTFDKSPSFLTQKTSHQIMLEAMAAAEGYPNCIPTKRNDPNSTPESLRYQSFHDGIVKLGKLLKQLDEDGGLKAAAKNSCQQANSGRVQFAAYQAVGGGAVDRAIEDAAGGSTAAY